MSFKYWIKDLVEHNRIRLASVAIIGGWFVIMAYVLTRAP